MSSIVKFLGQTVAVGDIVGDIAYYETKVGFESPCSYWDAIAYIVSVDGGIPASDKAYLFYNETTGDEDPVFGIKVIYTGSKFRIGYCMRAYDRVNMAWQAWSNIYNVIQWLPSDYDNDGADPHHITESDRYHNGLIFTNVSTATDTQRYVVGSRGFGLGVMTTYYAIAVEDPDVVIYEYSTNYTPPRYVQTGGSAYSMFDNASAQQVFPDFGWEFTVGLLEEISDFEEDYSTPSGGGGGGYSFYSDQLGFSDLPGLSLIDTGLASMWAPTQAQMLSFSQFLWSSSFFDNIIKLLSDPIDNIIQFGIVPFSVSSILGTAKEVAVGNVSTGVTMTPLTTQYIHLDLGYVSIPETWKTSLDYEGSVVSIFIPFVGMFEMTPEEVIKCDRIALGYNVDLFSGDFVAEILVQKRFPKGSYLNGITYHKSGNCMIKLPITGVNYGRTYSQAIFGLAGGAAGAAAGAGIGGIATSLVDSAIGIASVPVQRSGSYTGNAALMGCETPYILLTQPIQVLPQDYGKYEGYPSYITYTLSSLSGFTKVEELIDNTVEATDAEKDEIERLLKEGVYL